ncbi:cell wall hydrolase [Intestinibacter bartlettii]|uniref:Cell wall hydrolase n=2 Tax=Intestinibacter bartlettii TaxID=261299 RepID=A0ABS6DVG6_9FIRM|nr:cell wall hydrolase [Intestinibacter bartlettii]
MGTSTISAYEGNGLDFIRITSLLKQIQNKDNEVLNLYDLKNKKDEDIISCVRNVETSVNDIENTKQDVAQEETQAVMRLSDEQLNLLSKLVAAEARGESYEGQVAVAAVVLNRVKDARFPDSIEGVIYQKNAFSVVRDGYIDAQPTEESYKAAKEALYGSDPTNNAIYFWNPDISTCSWINTLNPHLRIGNHVFAR